MNKNIIFINSKTYLSADHDDDVLYFIEQKHQICIYQICLEVYEVLLVVNQHGPNANYVMNHCLNLPHSSPTNHDVEIRLRKKMDILLQITVSKTFSFMRIVLFCF